METWQKAFDPWGVHVGQMLLTRDDLSVRKRHVAVKAERSSDSCVRTLFP